MRSGGEDGPRRRDRPRWPGSPTVALPDTSAPHPTVNIKRLTDRNSTRRRTHHRD